MQPDGADVSHPTSLPPIVLKCPECPFLCASNNQMCRHIFMTYHCLAKCAECDMRLLIWTYCPGVVKMLHRAKKDGLISVVTSVETPEKHSSRTHHKGTRGNVWTKEDFQASGVPEDYGLTALPRCGSVPTFVGFKFQCPVCSRIISTWTQMTKHLDATNHSLARCAQCDLPLKCYGTNQPGKHERLTSHRGLVGYFRVKDDYVYNEPGGDRPGKLPQYACPDCGVTFFHTAYLAHHMIHSDHSANLALDTPDPECLDCGFQGTIEELDAHTRQSSHQGLLPDTESELHRQCLQTLSSIDGRGERGSRRERVVPTGSKVMYQCPECVAIFSSWTKMEKHIFYSKHSLPKCSQCGVYLRPRGWNSPEDHTAITGHQGLIGEVRKKFEYEVTVDTTDAELVELIDDPSGLPPKIAHDGAEGDAHLVFQCPVESCLHVCLSWVLLEKHFMDTRHGILQCAVCKEDVTPWKPHFADSHKGATGHEFKETPGSIIKTALEDYQVTITDTELLTYYGDKFKRCAECSQVMDANMMLAHMGSRRCQKNQERHRHDKNTPQKGSGERGNGGGNEGSTNTQQHVALPQPMTQQQTPMVQANHLHQQQQPGIAMLRVSAPTPIGVNSMSTSLNFVNLGQVGPTAPPSADFTNNFAYNFISYLRLPPNTTHEPALQLAMENPSRVGDVVTALHSFIQCSGDVGSSSLRVFWLLEPLARVMDPSLLPHVKSIIGLYYQMLPWATRFFECVQCIIHVSRVFDPQADRVTIMMLQQFLNERCTPVQGSGGHGAAVPQVFTFMQ